MCIPTGFDGDADVVKDIYILDSGSPSRDNDVRIPRLEKAMG
jgi:hypothetical protein